MNTLSNALETYLARITTIHTKLARLQQLETTPKPSIGATMEPAQAHSNPASATCSGVAGSRLQATSTR